MIEEQVKKLIEGPVGEVGVRIDSVTLEKESGALFLRIVIDRDEIIDVDTCVEVTNIINPLLDEANLIEEAYKTQKPTRIDFDNNVSVILRITKDGKVSAEFIPGDKAVEEYLRNNIGYLKQRFDEENISYHDIMYKPYKNNNKRQNQNKGGQQ